MNERLISLLGIFAFIGFGYLVSVNRSKIRWATVLWGIGLQMIFGFFILRTSIGLTLFKFLGDSAGHFLNFADSGSKFIFGDGFEEHFIAFKVLPTIIFFSAFISLLYYYQVLPKVVRALGWVMMRSMKTSGAESLSCAANIFVGQTEAPLVIKPYLANLTMSELHAVMTGGFATIAGGVMAAYIAFGIPAEHLIAASVMSAPAALAMAKIFYPETAKPETMGKIKLETEQVYINEIDAITSGALDGLKLALNVGAMLIAFLGLLALVNGVLGWFGQQVGLPQLSLEWILSYLMFPFAWLMGIPLAECLSVGTLLGKKVILNEFVAYLDLKELMPALSERTIIIATYALCGFANLGSMGIQIGGLSAISPSRQQDLAVLGFRAMIAGSLACFLTACVTGMLI